MQTVKGNINSPLTNYKKYPDEINIKILTGAHIILAYLNVVEMVLNSSNWRQMDEITQEHMELLEEALFA